MSTGFISSSNNIKNSNNKGVREDRLNNADSSFEKKDRMQPRIINDVNEYERSEIDEQNCVADIISQILNQRKP